MLSKYQSGIEGGRIQAFAKVIDVLEDWHENYCDPCEQCEYEKKTLEQFDEGHTCEVHNCLTCGYTVDVLVEARERLRG